MLSSSQTFKLDAFELSKSESRDLSKYQTLRVRVSSNLLRTLKLVLLSNFKLRTFWTRQTLNLWCLQTLRRSNSDLEPPGTFELEARSAVFALSSGIRLQTFELALASNLRARTSFKLLNFKLSTSVSFIVVILQKAFNLQGFNGHSSLQTLKRSKFEKSTRDTYRLAERFKAASRIRDSKVRTIRNGSEWVRKAGVGPKRLSPIK